MSYAPGSAPNDPKALADYISRELRRIAAFIADDADRVEFLPDVLTPPQITGNVNDYAPVGMESANVLRLSLDLAHNMTGLKNSAPGKPRKITLVNISANTLTLVHASASSAAANRFALPGAANLTITQNQSRTLWYDFIAGNWIALA